MPPPRTNSTRAIFLQFLLVALFFGASTLYTEWSHLSGFSRRFQDMTGNALPSIEQLTSARTELRHLEVRVDDLPAADGAAGDVVRERRQRLHTTVDAYLALPSFPDEEPGARALREALAGVDRAVEAVLAGGGPLAGEGARLLLAERAAVDRLDAELLALIGINLRHAYASVGDPREARRTLYHAVALDAFNVLLALGATALVFRTVRGHNRVMEAHQHVLTERAEELEQFAGRVAHDILNPLSTIKLSLELIGRMGPGDERLPGVVARGQAGITRAQRIVDGLLEFARAGARPPAEARAEARAVIDDVVSGLQEDAAKAGVEIAVQTETAPVVACSPGVLTSLLSNLARNAIKYMGESTARRVTIRLVEHGARARFEVADTGPGVPAELGETIFEPHVRGTGTGQPGIGLGLATVKRITEAHGGAVGYRSTPGSGSVFWFELPGAPAQGAG